MDDLQQRRIALNESRFRAANERIRSAVEEFEPGVETLTMMCECALTECVSMIDLDSASYERARANAAWFIVLPDHVIPAAEEVVTRETAFWIVEKIETGKQVAREQAEDLPS